jgi:ABC-type uncharacterized transport system involved in gliding motility auxiliary subunit
MIQHLSETMDALLFFPGANEVQDQTESYFSDMKLQSKHFKVRVVDHALDPELAKKYEVTDNGNVVLVRGTQHQQIFIGTELSQAKRNLKKLDSEFQKAFTRLMHDEKVAYFTVGHEERSREPRDDVSGSSIRDLRSILEQMNYTVKELGIGHGLALEVPPDASVVFIFGPRKEFLPEEMTALKNYLLKGGRMMAFLDPEVNVQLTELLQHFGIKFVPTRLANDRFYVRVTHTPADQYSLYSKQYSAHPSVSTLNRLSSQVATILLGSGYLEEMPSVSNQKSQVQFTMHSMPFTWNDINNNIIFDADREKRKVYEVASAITLKVPKAASLKSKNKPKSEDLEMRMVVVADSDMISDKIFRNAGNAYFFVDSLKWLGGEEEYIGETSSEEDVRILHTRNEDKVWFYLTLFTMPILVMSAGIFYSLRRRKKS